MIETISSALFSDDRRYRYALRRRWSDEPPVLFIGLNPSTADETQDDPTIRRCMRFARDWGHGGLLMGNLYAWRSPDPSALDGAHCVGEQWGSVNRNDVVLADLGREASCIVAAWGAYPGPVPSRDVQVLDVVGSVMALGLTKYGAPRHPLYMRADAQPVPFQLLDRPQKVGG